MSLFPETAGATSASVRRWRSSNALVLDLNGFELRNTAGSSTEANGIFAPNKRNIVIRNGTIRGFLRGILLERRNNRARNHLVEDIRAIRNRGVGINFQGENLVVRNNQVSQTGPSDVTSQVVGMVVNSFNNARVSNNTVSETSAAITARGIWAAFGDHLVIENNMVSDTGGLSSRAVRMDAVQRAHIVGNQFINQAGGDHGIYAVSSSAGITCSNNYIDAFDTVQQGCDNVSGTCHSACGYSRSG